MASKRHKAHERADSAKRRSVSQTYAIASAIIGLAIAWHAFTVTFDILFATRNPPLAQRVTDPPRAAVRLWQIAAITDASKFADPAIVDAARETLAQSPLDAEVLRAWAFYEDRRGQTSKASVLANLSERVTRRDTLNQLLLVEQKAKLGDIESAMSHFGIALSSTSRGRDQIFAAMAPMLDVPAFRSVLSQRGTLEKEWAADFFRFALINQPGAANNVAEIILLAPRSAASDLIQKIGPDLFSFVAETGSAETTREIFALYPDAKRGLLTDPRLSARTVDPALGWLAWTAIEDGSAGVQLGTTASDGYGALAYTGPGESGTVVLRRALFLSAGSYRISDDRELVSGESPVAFRWSINCHDGSAWRQLPATQTDGTGNLNIPQDCPMQLVELKAYAARTDPGAEVQIENFSVTRDGGAS